MDVSHAAPELQAKAAEVFPRAKETISKAIDRGARIACGTDAPAIPHGRNAKELIALVDRGMTPLQAIRAATTVSAELIDVDDRGRLEAGLLADVIGVPGDPLADIGVTEQVRFVMKGGQVYRNDRTATPALDAVPGLGQLTGRRADAVEDEVPQLLGRRRRRRPRATAPPIVDEKALNMIASSTTPAIGPCRRPARTAPAAAASSSTSSNSGDERREGAWPPPSGASVSSCWANSAMTGRPASLRSVVTVVARGRHIR